MAMLIKYKQSCIKKLDNFRGRLYDFIHHVDTFSFISRMAVRIESENKDFGLPYQRTNFRTMNTLFKQLTWSDNATFVDFGCGKGLTLLTAAKYSFKGIVGVEYSSDLVAIATKNVLRYRGALPSKKNIRVVHGDATQFEFPDTPLICYFYNPFQPVVMEKVFDNLALSLKKNAREIQLVFHIRYSRDLVKSKFEVLSCECIPYFHIYRLAFSKEKQEKPSTGIAPWETIDTEQTFSS